MSDGTRVALWPRMDRGRWALLGVILVSALVFRGLRLDELPAGFHVFNEGFYIDLASSMVRQPLFGWFLHPLDVNNPPLYSVIVSWLYRLGAPHVAGARIVSVLAGTWSVFVTFALGRLLYDERTGITAAAILAVMPGVVLVDHNIQVDPLFVALMLTSLWFYVASARSGSRMLPFVGGAILGLAFFKKQPAVIALPALAAWETWCARGLRWLRSDRVWKFALCFALVGVPWYVIQFFASGPGAMFANASNIASSGNLGPYFWFDRFGLELWWMVFPLTAVVAVAGLVVQAVRREPGDKFVLVMTAVFLLWYVVFNRHTYYLLPLGALAAMSAARALGSLQRFPRPVFAGALALLLVSMAMGTVLMMAGHKWGRWSPMSLQAPARPPGEWSLAVGNGVGDLFGPTMNLVDPRFVVKQQSDGDYRAEALKSGKPGDASLLLSLVPPPGARPRQILEATWLRPVLFGYAIALAPEDRVLMNEFRGAAWSSEQVGPIWSFGLQSTQVPSGYFLYDHTSFGPQASK